MLWVFITEILKIPLNLDILALCGPSSRQKILKQLSLKCAFVFISWFSPMYIPISMRWKDSRRTLDWHTCNFKISSCTILKLLLRIQINEAFYEQRSSGFRRKPKFPSNWEAKQESGFMDFSRKTVNDLTLLVE